MYSFRLLSCKQLQKQIKYIPFKLCFDREDNISITKCIQITLFKVLVFKWRLGKGFREVNYHRIIWNFTKFKSLQYTNFKFSLKIDVFELQKHGFETISYIT